MKLFFLIIATIVGTASGVAQSLLRTNLTEKLDFDRNDIPELLREVYAERLGTMPEDWFCGNYLNPWGTSRLLRGTTQRIPLTAGQSIDANLKVHSYKLTGGSGTPPREYFDLMLIQSRAMSFDGGATWQYQTVTPAFEKESEVLLGLKLALPTGTHYGWLKLGRAVADLHTPFEVRSSAYHPVAGEPIGAGEPPPPPPLQSAVVAEDGSLNFSWDTAWGEVLLEWTDNLAVPNWQPVPDGTVPPVTQLPTEAQRFYRLRRP